MPEAGPQIEAFYSLLGLGRDTHQVQRVAMHKALSTRLVARRSQCYLSIDASPKWRRALSQTLKPRFLLFSFPFSPLSLSPPPPTQPFACSTIVYLTSFPNRAPQTTTLSHHVLWVQVCSIMGCPRAANWMG
jgi:hypothetical protein